jgi:hypothetical protein
MLKHKTSSLGWQTRLTKDTGTSPSPITRPRSHHSLATKDWEGIGQKKGKNFFPKFPQMFVLWHTTGLVPSLSKDVLQWRLERVVDSFAMKPEHVVCLISIKSVYSCCLCMYSSVQVSLFTWHSSLSLGDQSRGGGGCPWTRKSSTLGFV